MTDGTATDVGGGAGATNSSVSAPIDDVKTTAAAADGVLPAGGWVDTNSVLHNGDGSVAGLYVRIAPNAPAGTADTSGAVPPLPVPKPDVPQPSNIVPGLLGLLNAPGTVPSWLWLALALGAVFVLTRHRHGSRAA